MNKREKEVIQNQLNSEKEVLEKIKGVYEDALTGIDDKIKLLMSDELTQSKIYQIDYQKALKGQISAILDAMNDQQYEKVSDYLNDCYENGFIGTMYNLQGQGVPLVIPIDQEQIVQAIQKDTKLSEPLYKRLGQDVNELKTAINAEISRGIASALPYSDIALNVKNRTNVGINRTMTIARTEGHRVSQEASYHAQIKAKERGADIVKEWDATLDSRTRKSHSALDGQIRELEEPFEINGRKAMHPSDFGVASEDVNCRCVCLQRARWGITDEEFTKMNGGTGELVRLKEKDYQRFKESYKMQMKEEIKKQETKANLGEWTRTMSKRLDDAGVEYREVSMHSTPLSEKEIISVLGGADRTNGSCSSLSLSYLGQKKGMDVLDFRGGESSAYFADKSTKKLFFQQSEGCTIVERGKNTTAVGKSLLGKVEEGKEYILGVGAHSSVVRKQEGVLQYLELQSPNICGWKDFDSKVTATLHNRFGTSTTGFHGKAVYEGTLVDIENFDAIGDLQHILGYINTSKS